MEKHGLTTASDIVNGNYDKKTRAPCHVPLPNAQQARGQLLADRIGNCWNRMGNTEDAPPYRIICNRQGLHGPQFRSGRSQLTLPQDLLLSETEPPPHTHFTIHFPVPKCQDPLSCWQRSRQRRCLVTARPQIISAPLHLEILIDKSQAELV